ncbi:PhzF family phenazine biosynthesis protein [Algirhabdus cladophorae]|uniref:PhzF family phenazine biosynthesis protein n=1 Tax=Algirhabdus cladophorae TaxID=3377108 RepID=UPI003B8454D9
MTKYAVDWVDAFTDRPFSGNGCAVVQDAGALDDATCMAFVAETSLVECTFVEPSDIADFKVRYFLASREIPFAGHPTIATVAAFLSRGMVNGTSLTLETGAGLVAVEIDASLTPPRISMTQVAPAFGPKLDPVLVAAVGGLTAQDIISPPQIVSTGLPFCITVLANQGALDRCTLDVEALAALAAASGSDGIDMMEPFWVTLDGQTTLSRLLMAPPSPAEDAFTGSASGAMAAYLWANGLIKSPHLRATQGHMLGRLGQADVTVQGPPDAITGVQVAGQAYVLMSGELSL